MRNLLAKIGLVLFLVAASACSPLQPIDTIAVRQSEIVNAVVRIESGQTTGSGTVISVRDGKAIVVTNDHVVRAAIAGTTVGKPKVTLRAWIVRDGRTYPVTYSGEVIADDQDGDLAMIEMSGWDTWQGGVATLARDNDPPIPDETVWICGAALGKRVHITTGTVSIAHDELDGADHIVTSAPVFPGNSGGSLWLLREGRYEMAGVPRAIAVLGFGSMAPTLNYSIPIRRVRAFLKANGVNV